MECILIVPRSIQQKAGLIGGTVLLVCSQKSISAYVYRAVTQLLVFKTVVSLITWLGVFCTGSVCCR